MTTCVNKTKCTLGETWKRVVFAVSALILILEMLNVLIAVFTTSVWTVQARTILNARISVAWNVVILRTFFCALTSSNSFSSYREIGSQVLNENLKSHTIDPVSLSEDKYWGNNIYRVFASCGRQRGGVTHDIVFCSDEVKEGPRKYHKVKKKHIATRLRDIAAALFDELSGDENRMRVHAAVKW